jgi:hypothetical protein
MFPSPNARLILLLAAVLPPALASPPVDLEGLGDSSISPTAFPSSFPTHFYQEPTDDYLADFPELADCATSNVAVSVDEWSLGIPPNCTFPVCWARPMR